MIILILASIWCNRYLNSKGPCVYKKMQGSMVIFMILYVDDILLIGNDVGLLSLVKIWLSTQFQMKDLGQA